MENTWTREQLLSVILPERERIDAEAHCPTDGRETFISAESGRLRALAYNMDDARVLPLFINLHGGGFALGHAEMDDPFLADVAALAGIKILNLDYSLTPESPYPKQLNECLALIEHVKTHPDEFGVDPERIALGGHSAGATIAAAAVLSGGARLGLRCLILDYPLLDLYTNSPESLPPFGGQTLGMSDIFRICYLPDRQARRDILVSPFFASDSQLSVFPPTLITTCYPGDELEPEAIAFRDRLLSIGVETEYRQFIAQHAFNTRPGPLTNESWALMSDFLKARLHCE